MPLFTFMFGNLLRYLIVLMSFNSCLSFLDSGTNTVINETPNYANQIKAVLFKKEAGATVPDSYQLSIIGLTDNLHNGDVGNVFSVKASSIGPDTLYCEWIGNDTLCVYQPKKFDPYFKILNVERIKIIYKYH
jgi:hypothetical protein